MHRVNEILSDLINQGYLPDDIKEGFIKLLSELFENGDNLREFAMTNDIFQMVDYRLQYYYDPTYLTDIINILSYYRKAYEKSPLEVNKVFWETFNLNINRENFFYSQLDKTLDPHDPDIYNFTFSCMEKIGVVLEAYLKLFLMEFYAIFLIANNKPVEFLKITNLDFGVINNNLLETNSFDNFLKISPINIKLSDWRNIAYHHTFTIKNDLIVCTYGRGKQEKQFNINREELLNYVIKIVRSANEFYMAHFVFLFDNFHSIVDYCRDKNGDIINLRPEIFRDSLKGSFLGQGYLLVNLETSEQLDSAILWDCYNDGSLSEDELLKRKIHASQFLYNIWYNFPSNNVLIKYCDNKGNLQMTFKVDGNICEQVGKGEKDISFMASKVLFKKE